MDIFGALAENWLKGKKLTADQRQQDAQIKLLEAQANSANATATSNLYKSGAAGPAKPTVPIRQVFALALGADPDDPKFDYLGDSEVPVDNIQGFGSFLRDLSSGKSTSDQTPGKITETDAKADAAQQLAALRKAQAEGVEGENVLVDAGKLFGPEFDGQMVSISLANKAGQYRSGKGAQVEHEANATSTITQLPFKTAEIQSRTDLNDKKGETEDFLRPKRGNVLDAQAGKDNAQAGLYGAQHERVDFLAPLEGLLTQAKTKTEGARQTDLAASAGARAAAGRKDDAQAGLYTEQGKTVAAERPGKVALLGAKVSAEQALAHAREMVKKANMSADGGVKAVGAIIDAYKAQYGTDPFFRDNDTPSLEDYAAATFNVRLNSSLIGKAVADQNVTQKSFGEQVIDMADSGDYNGAITVIAKTPQAGNGGIDTAWEWFYGHRATFRQALGDNAYKAMWDTFVGRVKNSHKGWKPPAFN